MWWRRQRQPRVPTRDSGARALLEAVAHFGVVGDRWRRERAASPGRGAASASMSGKDDGWYRRADAAAGDAVWQGRRPGAQARLRAKKCASDRQRPRASTAATRLSNADVVRDRRILTNHGTHQLKLQQPAATS